MDLKIKVSSEELPNKIEVFISGQKAHLEDFGYKYTTQCYKIIKNDNLIDNTTRKYKLEEAEFKEICNILDSIISTRSCLNLVKE